MARLISMVLGAALCLCAASAQGNRGRGGIEVRVSVYKGADLIASPAQTTLPGQALFFRLGVEPRPVKLTVTPVPEGEAVRLIVERFGKKPVELTVMPDEAAPLDDVARGYMVSLAAR